MNKMILEDKGNIPNLKKLAWFEGISLHRIADLAGMKYAKVQRVFDRMDVDDITFGDLKIFCEIFGYATIEEFMQAAIDVNPKERNRETEMLLNKAIQEQQTFNYIMPSTRDSLLRAGNLTSKYNANGIDKRYEIIGEAIEKTKPQKPMREAGIDHFNTSDGTRVYTLSDSDSQ